MGKEKPKSTKKALRGRPKKTVKYTKTINVRLTQSQWIKTLSKAETEHLEPSVYIRKVLLEALGQ